MPPPLPRCSRWAYSSLKLTHPCQPSPKPLSGRPAHRPFRGLLGVHSRCGLHTRAVTKTVTVYPKASDTSSPPCLLRSLPAGAVAGRGLHPLETRRLVTAHVEARTWLVGLACAKPKLCASSSANWSWLGCGGSFRSLEQHPFVRSEMTIPSSRPAFRQSAARSGSQGCRREGGGTGGAGAQRP